MAEYRLTPAAERDLENIWLYTRQQWSAEQADRYAELLANAFADLVQAPKIATSRVRFKLMWAEAAPVTALAGHTVGLSLTFPGEAKQLHRFAHVRGPIKLHLRSNTLSPRTCAWQEAAKLFRGRRWRWCGGWDEPRVSPHQFESHPYKPTRHNSVPMQNPQEDLPPVRPAAMEVAMTTGSASPFEKGGKRGIFGGCTTTCVRNFRTVKSPSFPLFQRGRTRRTRIGAASAHISLNRTRRNAARREFAAFVAEFDFFSGAQIIRDLMRLYIADNETPNTSAAETLRKSDRGEDLFYASDATDLFRQLGI